MKCGRKGKCIIPHLPFTYVKKKQKENWHERGKNKDLSRIKSSLRINEQTQHTYFRRMYAVYTHVNQFNIHSNQQYRMKLTTDIRPSFATDTPISLDTPTIRGNNCKEDEQNRGNGSAGRLPTAVAKCNKIKRRYHSGVTQVIQSWLMV